MSAAKEFKLLLFDAKRAKKKAEIPHVQNDDRGCLSVQPVKSETDDAAWELRSEVLQSAFRNAFYSKPY